MKRYIRSSTHSSEFSVMDVFREAISFYEDEDIQLIHYDDETLVFTVNGQKCSVRNYNDFDEAGLSFELENLIDNALGY